MRNIKKNMKYAFLLILLQIIILCNISTVLAAESNPPTNCSIKINSDDSYTRTKYVTLDIYGVDESAMQVWISNDGNIGTVVDYSAGKTINITDTNYTVGTALSTSNSTTATNTNNVLRIQNWPLGESIGNQKVSVVFRDAYGNKTSVSDLTTITITYDMNGKSGLAPTANTTVKNLGVYLPTATTTQGGFTYLGWSVSKKATAASYLPGTMYVDNTNRTLYAIWKAITYQVTYNANGGSLGDVPSSEEKTWGTDYTINANLPSKEGYKFMGWSTSATGNVQYQPGDKYITEANLNLYAIYYPIITGNVSISGTLTYGQTLTANVSNLWPSDSSLSYQWYYNTTESTTGGLPIANANTNTYTIANGFTDKYIYVEVKATGNKYIETTFKDLADSTNNGSSTVRRISLTIPTATTSYAYTGSTITLGVNNYNSSLMTISGNTGLNAGNYTATISLIDTINYQWSNGSISELNINWNINKVNLTIPTAPTTAYTYTGSTITLGVNNYNSSLMSITGNTGVNVKYYTAVISLRDTTNYQWSNGNITDVNISWSINKASLAKPTPITTEYNYTGSTITLQLSGYNSGTMNITGNTGINITTYTAKISLKDTTNYQWSDGTTTSVTIGWEIKVASEVWNVNKTYSWTWNYDNPTYWESYSVIDTRDYTDISKIEITFSEGSHYDVDMPDWYAEYYDRQTNIQMKISTSDPWSAGAGATLFAGGSKAGTITIDTSSLSGSHKMYMFLGACGRHVSIKINTITFYY